ncbi:MAG: hypothetical protein M3P51_09225 [Chloroflexota bacterium]|nr:hypothetical protein [Chloroflexota bacterium]
MASQHGPYDTSCQGKVRHATHKEARSMVNRLKRLYGAQYLVIYPCLWCHYLHVGHGEAWLVGQGESHEWTVEVVA